MIPRVLEPEVMDTEQEASEYDAMDHSEVNRLFVEDCLSVVPDEVVQPDCEILDVGTGTALIPIEFCRQVDWGKIRGIDLAVEMLKLARVNVENAGLAKRIFPILCDAKQLPFENDRFSLVISNSIIHHIPEPLESIREMVRVLQPGGFLFVRDLMRPETADQVEELVTQYAGNETEYSRQLLRQSLHAALTVEEAQNLLSGLNLPRDSVRATSDRHWTISIQIP